MATVDLYPDQRMTEATYFGRLAAKRPRRQVVYAGAARRRTRARYYKPYLSKRKWECPKELKFIDSELQDEVFTQNWAAKNPTTQNCISAVAQGDTEHTRDGRTYWISSIHIRGEFIVPAVEAATAPVADVIARICVILDTQTNGTEIVATEIMESALQDDYNAFRNLHSSQRATVLYDKRVRIVLQGRPQGAIDLFSHNRKMIPFTFNKRFKKPIRVNTSTTAQTVGAIVDNSISVIGVASATNVTLNYTSRLRFFG